MNAAAPLEQSIADRLCKQLDCVLTQWYGLTEASPSVITQRPDQVHIRGTVGKALPGITIKILDENEEGMNRESVQSLVSNENVRMQAWSARRNLRLRS